MEKEILKSCFFMTRLNEARPKSMAQSGRLRKIKEFRSSSMSP